MPEKSASKKITNDLITIYIVQLVTMEAGMIF